MYYPLDGPPKPPDRLRWRWKRAWSTAALRRSAGDSDIFGVSEWPESENCP